MTSAQVIIVMGVSASGKTTIGKAIAGKRHAVFIDGDDLHPVENIRKMSKGIALTDADRRAWFEHIIKNAGACRAEGASCIIACSALKKKYRDMLRSGIPGVLFVYLKSSYSRVYQQMMARSQHFMPLALLKSQFDTLEEPGPDEKDVLVVAMSDNLQHDIVAVLKALESNFN